MTGSMKSAAIAKAGSRDSKILFDAVTLNVRMEDEFTVRLIKLLLLPTAAPLEH
jgi:hypothetical protein